MRGKVNRRLTYALLGCALMQASWTLGESAGASAKSPRLSSAAMCGKIAEVISVELRARGLSEESAISPGQLDCRAEAAVAPAAELEVSRIGWDAVLGSWQARLRCRESRECIPFLVPIRLNDPAATALRQNLNRLPQRERSSGAREGPDPVRIAKHAKGQENLVQAGRPARLILESGAVRIALPVICLEDGGEGQQVRAAQVPDVRFNFHAGIFRGSADAGFGSEALYIPTDT